VWGERKKRHLGREMGCVTIAAGAARKEQERTLGKRSSHNVTERRGGGDVRGSMRGLHKVKGEEGGKGYRGGTTMGFGLTGGGC